jgi:signal transduction histidine kinase/ActR/RegA family two-component response regulator
VAPGGDSYIGETMDMEASSVTQLRALNDELRVANERLSRALAERGRTNMDLRGAVDAVGMGSFELHLASGSVRRSTRHDQIFGYEDMQDAWDLETTLAHVVPEDRALLREAFEQACRTGNVDAEVRISHLTEGTRWVHFSGRTYYADKEPVRIAGVVADITQRRDVEERMRQAQKIEALGQLAGGVAHDFNNLLQVISSGLEVITRPGDATRRERLVAAMKRSVDRGAGLCRQLLAFSRRQTLKPVPLDIHRLIEGMSELLSHSLRGDVVVQTEFESSLWPIEVDPGELELVILNLAVNARDAMPKGGTLRIHVDNEPGLDKHGVNGDFVRIDIVDSGVGMSPDVLSHAFEPFFTTKEIGHGSGLGLAQVHGFARASGGVARIDSSPGLGTTVSLYLPRTLKEPAPASQVAQAVEKGSYSGNILIVEDDDEVAALTVEMVSQLGYDTTRVSSAEAALGALADRRSVDVVFSDVMMPGRMNGVELAQEIRRRRPNLPVLLTSGYAESARPHAAAHQIRIIPKPYGLEQLRDALAEVARDNRNSVREH